MTREEQLDHIRLMQRLTTETPERGGQVLRIILEFKTPPDSVAVIGTISKRLGIDVTASGLLVDDGRRQVILAKTA